MRRSLAQKKHVRNTPRASAGRVWALLHSGETCEPFPGISFVPGYPLLPWIGVMAVGYGFGKWLLCPQEQRRMRLLRAGVLLTLGFVVLRLTNVYGDPLPWSVQKNGWFTVFSLINCAKYPPSLLFLLMTLGSAITALAWLDRAPPWFSQPLLIVGASSEKRVNLTNVDDTHLQPKRPAKTPR